MQGKKKKVSCPCCKNGRLLNVVIEEQPDHGGVDIKCPVCKNVIRITFHNRKIRTTVADKMYELRDQKRRVLLDEANRDTAAKKVEELIGFIGEQRGKPVGYDEGLVRKLIEKVIVYDDSFKVVFKSGIDVNIEA